MKRECIESKDKTHRYRLFIPLYRSHGQRCTFLMLNPSLADEKHDDATSSKCIRYADRWHMQSVTLVNLFSFRTPYPTALILKIAEARAGKNPARAIAKLSGGRINDGWIVDSCRPESCDLLICAWGAHGNLAGRDQQVQELLKRTGRQLHCLGLNKDGSPKHPLYLLEDTEPQLFRV